MDEFTKEEILTMVVECDGAEIPRDLWPLAEELVNDGKITLGNARGPGRDWRRAELVEEGE